MHDQRHSRGTLMSKIMIGKQTTSVYPSNWGRTHKNCADCPFHVAVARVIAKYFFVRVDISAGLKESAINICDIVVILQLTEEDVKALQALADYKGCGSTTDMLYNHTVVK